MQVSDKLLKKFKTLMKERGREYESDDKARAEAQSVVNYVELVYEVATKEMKRQAKLKDHPKGYPIEEGGYMCLLCRRAITKVNGWYDKNGFKCLDCQGALDKKLIPITALKDRDSWFADWQIHDEFGIHPSTARKLAREGLLRGIDLKEKDGGIYLTVYLHKDNQKFLNQHPKKKSYIKMTISESGGKK